VDGARFFLVVSSNMTRSNRHKLKHTYVPSEHKEDLLYFEGDGALEQAAQGGYGISFSRDIQNLSGEVLCNVV